jgi:hypothetical protein
MSPRLEAGINPEIKEEFNYFTIDLKDPSDFNPVEFDTLAKEVDLRFNDKVSQLKYVVVGDIMHIFATGGGHDDVYKTLRKNNVEGRLQSAGKIWVWHNEGLTPTQKRNISGYSVTLGITDLLGVEDSEKYKKEKIEPALGNYFEIKYEKAK